MITIKTHLNYLEEIKWLSQVIFEEILGLNYIIQIHDEEDFKIITNEKEIVLENFFLKEQKKNGLNHSLLRKRKSNTLIFLIILIKSFTRIICQ